MTAKCDVVKVGALLLCLVVFGNGCSMLFVKPPGRSSGGSGCTTSKAPPVLDTMFAGWQMVRIGIAAGASEETYRGAALTREADILLGVLLGIVGASSAVYGFRTVEECRSSGEYARPYAPARAPARTRQQQKADEAAEEAAVQARLRARAAAAAKAAQEEEADDDADDAAPSVTPAAAQQPGAPSAPPAVKQQRDRE
jgi:pyruvate/2-oxoglutarate dehydrogenase complex dihydrolipoamide acyltransferase (E2) component